MPLVYSTLHWSLDQCFLKVFDKLRDSGNSETILSKLKCLSGDVVHLNLNLDEDVVQELEQNVSVVFHMAANVRFDQPLKSAVLLNTGSHRGLCSQVPDYWFSNLQVVLWTCWTWLAGSGTWRCLYTRPRPTATATRRDWRRNSTQLHTIQGKVMILQGKLLTATNSSYSKIKKIIFEAVLSL